MKDVQNEQDSRNISIDRVGVSGVSYPIVVLDPEFSQQHTVARVSMSVSLPEDTRGTHMSRFIGLLNDFQGKVTLDSLEDMVDIIKDSLSAEKAQLSFEFPYFAKKKAPVSRIESYSRYDVLFLASKEKEQFDFILEVKIPVQTLCPCSREISEAGAHNQRASVDIAIRMKSLVWIEEIAEIGEKAASAPVFSLLKREDEKFVTEFAYSRPRFVEDVTREAVLSLEKDHRITWFRVKVISQESIHNHDAFAEIERSMER